MFDTSHVSGNEKSLNDRINHGGLRDDDRENKTQNKARRHHVHDAACKQCFIPADNYSQHLSSRQTGFYLLLDATKTNCDVMIDGRWWEGPKRTKTPLNVPVNVMNLRASPADGSTLLHTHTLLPPKPPEVPPPSVALLPPQPPLET